MKMQNTIIAVDKQHLNDLIKQEMYANGNQCDLNHIDVSLIEDMNHLFLRSKFNGDISKWDVSNVKYMSHLFQNSDFNGDISMWDVSQVESMDFMFYQSKFNGNILNWKPYKLILFESILRNCIASTPYWTMIDDNDKRKIAIDAYHLHKQLDNDLIISNTSSKKIKI